MHGTNPQKEQASSFVSTHGLWSDEQKDAAGRMRRQVEEQNLHSIRLSFPDQHGILRGKTLMAADAISSIESGCSITTTLLAKDTSHRTVFPVFSAGGGFGMSEMQGGGDVLMIADPTTLTRNVDHGNCSAVWGSSRSSPTRRPVPISPPTSTARRFTCATIPSLPAGRAASACASPAVPVHHGDPDRGAAATGARR